MASKIVQLEFVFQRIATPAEIKQDEKRQKDLKELTGWREQKVKLRSYRDFLKVDIPVGVPGVSTEMLKRTIYRAIVSYNRPEYEYVYVVGHFEDLENASEFSRTVVPKTAISVFIRRV